MQIAVIHFLPRAEAAGNQKGIECGLVAESVVGDNGETGLGLDRALALRDHEYIQLGIKPPCDRDHAIGRRKIHHLGIFKHINTESKTSVLGHASLLEGLSTLAILRATQLCAITTRVICV